MVWRTPLNRVAGKLTPLLALHGCTANQVTAVSLIAGVGGCLLYLSPHVTWNTAGWLLLLAWSVLDRVDGMLARFNGNTTRLGGFLDEHVSTLLSTLLFLTLPASHGDVTLTWMGGVNAVCHALTRSIFTLKEAEKLDFFRQPKSIPEYLMLVGYNVTNLTGLTFLLLPFTVTGNTSLYLQFNLPLAAAAYFTVTLLHVKRLKEDG